MCITYIFYNPLAIWLWPLQPWLKGGKRRGRRGYEGWRGYKGQHGYKGWRGRQRNEFRHR